MPEKTTCRNGNAYGGGIVLQGWHPTHDTVSSGNMVPFGFEEEQRNPDLAPFTDGEAEFEQPAKRVKK